MSPRIFIGLKEIAGYYSNLKRGFDDLGVESTFVCLTPQPFGYSIDTNPRWAVLVNQIASLISRYFTGSWWKRAVWTGVVQNFLAVLIFPFVALKYDVFIYGSVSTFFFFLELPILKLLGKKVIYVFHGSDTRPAFLNGYVVQDESKSAIRAALNYALIQKIIVRVVDYFADGIVNIPPQSYYHGRSIINGYIVGVPFAEPRLSALPPPTPSTPGSIRIVHGPSKPGPKGTAEIRKIISGLQERGFPIDYLEITNRPNVELLAELRHCDFVVDEIYSDTPMAGFATEAAYFGKPAVIGSYYATEITATIPRELVPPSLFCSPNDLASAVEKLTVDKQYREQLGRAAQAFVRDRWNPKAVAERFLKIARGEVPTDWMFDPHEISYLYGCGLSDVRAQRVLRACIERRGTGALWLDDKPTLKERLVALAFGTRETAQVGKN